MDRSISAIALAKPRVILDMVAITAKDARKVTPGRPITFMLGSIEVTGRVSRVLSSTQVEVTV